MVCLIHFNEESILLEASYLRVSATGAVLRFPIGGHFDEFLRHCYEKFGDVEGNVFSISMGVGARVYNRLDAGSFAVLRSGSPPVYGMVARFK